jgi:serpin B
MYQREEFRYLQDRDFQAVNLDFEGGAVSMIVLLPDWKTGIGKLESRLTAGMLRECFPRMVECDVHLYLPRFRMTWGTENLTAALQALGMTLAFDPLRADFSGISGQTPPHEDSVFLSAVFHQARVEVNEEGAEAAAATAVTMFCGAAPSQVVTFRADRPFLFAIRETATGAILFLGRVADPVTLDA